MKIKRADLSTIKMVAGGEKRYPKVVLDGRVKEWVGFGWIDLREAEQQDFLNLPVVED
jgi:hypothetical protein